MRGTIALVALLVAAGCATTRLPRPIGPANVASVVLAAPMAPADGTLVVEAIEAPVPGPQRLPSAVADAVTYAERADAPLPSAPCACSWDPLPSYVDQFTGTGWVSRPLFTGARPPTAHARGSWAPAVSTPYGYARYGAPSPYGYARSVAPSRSSSPHFSSPPAFSGY